MKDQEQEERTRVPSPGVVLVEEVDPSSGTGVGKMDPSSGTGVGKMDPSSGTGAGKRVPVMGRRRRKRSGNSSSSPTIPYNHPYHYIHHHHIHHHSPVHRSSDGNGIQVPQFLDPFRDVHQWYHPFASPFSADCSSPFSADCSSPFSADCSSPPPGAVFAKRTKMGSKGRRQQEGVRLLPEDGRREGGVHGGGIGEEGVASALRRFPSTDFTLSYEPLSLSVGRMSPLNLNLSPSIPGAVPGSELSPRSSILDNYEALLNLAERLGEAKSKGLPKEEINQLPSYRCTSTHSLDSDQSSCVVCMNDFHETQMLRILPCFHEFHAKCVDKWLKSSRTCPICRRRVDQPQSYHQQQDSCCHHH